MIFIHGMIHHLKQEPFSCLEFVHKLFHQVKLTHKEQKSMRRRILIFWIAETSALKNSFDSIAFIVLEG